MNRRILIVGRVLLALILFAPSAAFLCACDSKKNKLNLPPTISEISPEGGPLTGGTLTVYGSNFNAATKVTVGGKVCAVASNTQTRLTCTLPALTVGWKDVTVTNAGTTSIFADESASLPSAYAAGALVLNQPDFTTNSLPLETSMRRPYYLASWGGNLAVSDSGVSRVTVWDTAPSSNSQPSRVFGEYSLTNFQGVRDASSGTLISPASSRGSCSDGNRLFISDPVSHQVLVWNTVPSNGYTSPDFVIGQAQLGDTDENAGGAASASSLSAPVGIYCDSSRLIVADSGNNRVLIWTHAISQNAQAADIVLGQADFTSVDTNRGGAAALNTMRTPYDVAFNGSVLAVADRGNNRVLLFNGMPGVSGTAATVILGQTTVSAVAASTTQGRFRVPTGVSIGSDHVAVADYNNHRVMIWTMGAATDPLGWAHGRNADYVLGQSLFTTNTINNGGLSGASMYNPFSVRVVGSRLYVADYNNNRVLGWNNLPSSSGQAADFVLGQRSLATNNSSDGLLPYRRLGITPYDAQLVGTKLYVVDFTMNRLGIFSTLPTSNTSTIDAQYGQADLNSSAFASTASAGILKYPTGVTYDASSGKFLVADYLLDRVLIFNSPPTAGASADIVIGQTSLTGTGAGSAANKLSGPIDTCVTGGTLFIADRDNNRVLGFHSIPTADNASADFVLGQTAFGVNSANQGNASASADSMSFPSRVYCDSERLIVTDVRNNRVLIFSPLPSSTGEAASVVLGQGDFISASANQGLDAPTAATLYTPHFATVIDGKLWVSDSANNRLLVWDSVPTSSGRAADHVWGQADFVSNRPNRGSLTPGLKTLFSAYTVFNAGNSLVGVVDPNNARILIFPNPF